MQAKLRPRCVYVVEHILVSWNYYTYEVGSFYCQNYCGEWVCVHHCALCNRWLVHAWLLYCKCMFTCCQTPMILLPCCSTLQYLYWSTSTLETHYYHNFQEHIAVFREEYLLLFTYDWTVSTWEVNIGYKMGDIKEFWVDYVMVMHLLPRLLATLRE
jgi:hypothetical protein